MTGIAVDVTIERDASVEASLPVCIYFEPYICRMSPAHFAVLPRFRRLATTLICSSGSHSLKYLSRRLPARVSTDVA